MSTGIQIDSDIFSMQELILNFNTTTFGITILLFLSIVLIVFILHGILLVPRYRLKGFDFSTGNKKEFGNLFRFIYMTFNTYFDIALGLSSKLNFIKFYGIDVLNYLNFETKFFLCAFLQCCVIIISAGIFSLLHGGTFHFISFLTGQYEFKTYYPFYLFYAVTFNIFLHLTTKSLYLNAKDFHLNFILENKDLDSQYSLIANVCYISKINRQIKKQELERDLMQILGLYPGDFILVLFPKISRLCELQMEMDNLTDVYQYHKKQTSWWFSFFYSKQKEESKYKEKMSKLRFLYKEEKQSPVTYNGRGMIFFYRIGDVETFYKLNKEFTVKSRYEGGDKSRPFLSKSVKSIEDMKKTFLLSYNDLIIRSLDVNTKINTLFRAGFYVILFLILIFISTPNTIIQTIVNGVVNSFDQQEQAKAYFARKDIQVMLSMFFPLITTLFNLVIIIMIEQLGQFQRFTRHSSYQGYMIRFAFIYLLVNMFVIPGFSLGTNSSMFDMFVKQRFSIIKMLKSIRLEEKGQYFATFIVQSSITSFICYIPILKEIARTRFSYDLLFKYLKDIRKNPYRKLEADLYEFGYNYSADAVIIFIMASFGIFQPLIFFSGAAFFLIKGVGNVNALTSFYKGQSYAKTKYLDKALNRVRFASFVGLFFISIKAYLVENYNLLLLSLILAAVSCGNAVLNRRSSFKVSEMFLASYQIKLGREDYQRPCTPYRCTTKKRTNERGF